MLQKTGKAGNSREKQPGDCNPSCMKHSSGLKYQAESSRPLSNAACQLGPCLERVRLWKMCPSVRLVLYVLSVTTLCPASVCYFFYTKAVITKQQEPHGKCLQTLLHYFLKSGSLYYTQKKKNFPNQTIKSGFLLWDFWSEIMHYSCLLSPGTFAHCHAQAQLISCPPGLYPQHLLQEATLEAP